MCNIKALPNPILVKNTCYVDYVRRGNTVILYYAFMGKARIIRTYNYEAFDIDSLLLFLDYVIDEFGVPSEIVTNYLPLFETGMFEDFCKTWDIKHDHSFSHHSQCKAKVKKILRDFLGHKEK